MKEWGKCNGCIHSTITQIDESEYHKILCDKYHKDITNGFNSYRKCGGYEGYSKELLQNLHVLKTSDTIEEVIEKIEKGEYKK